MGGIVTISGSPDPIVNTPTTYTFDISTGAIGNTSICADDTETITLNVNPQSTLVYAGAAGLDNQESCDGTSIQEIRYTLGGGATDVTVNFQAGLGFTNYPGGTANVRVNDPRDPANSVVIYGTPNIGNTETQVFTYTIITVNPNTCLPEITLNGSISVLPEESLTHNALTLGGVANGALTQDVCYGAGVVAIELVVVGANTFATIDPPASLPSGVNFNFSPDADNMGGVVTISGSPDATINLPTTYTFDVTTGVAGNTSVCTDDTETITMTVNPQSSLTFTGANTLLLNQSVCFGGDIEDVNFVAGGGADDVILTVTAPPGAPALGWTTATNIRRDPLIPDSFILHGTATLAAPIAVPVTYSYQVETVNLYGCNPEIIIGGTITVFPTVTVTLPGNVTENDPLCFRGPGSIVLSPAAVSGGITSQQQQTRVEINNNFIIGEQITFTIAGIAMPSYTVQ